MKTIGKTIRALFSAVVLSVTLLSAFTGCTKAFVDPVRRTPEKSYNFDEEVSFSRIRVNKVLDDIYYLSDMVDLAYVSQKAPYLLMECTVEKDYNGFFEDQSIITVPIFIMGEEGGEGDKNDFEQFIKSYEYLYAYIDKAECNDRIFNGQGEEIEADSFVNLTDPVRMRELELFPVKDGMFDMEGICNYVNDKLDDNLTPENIMDFGGEFYGKSEGESVEIILKAGKKED